MTAPAIGFCPLSWGLGNRLNGVLNHIPKGDGVMFGWPVCPDHCGATWEDLFSTQLNVLPWDSMSAPKEWTRLTQDYWFNPAISGQSMEEVRQFIHSLKPSAVVRARMVDIPKGTVGWHVRSLAPASRIAKRDIVTVPRDVFLACDYTAQLMKSPNVYQTRMAQRSDYDKGRGLSHMLTAVADWFCLMQCESIVEVGLPFKGFRSIHSTYTDCHRLIGIPVTNLTRD